MKQTKEDRKAKAKKSVENLKREICQHCKNSKGTPAGTKKKLRCSLTNEFKARKDTCGEFRR